MKNIKKHMMLVMTGCALIAGALNACATCGGKKNRRSDIYVGPSGSGVIGGSGNQPYSGGPMPMMERSSGGKRRVRVSSGSVMNRGPVQNIKTMKRDVQHQFTIVAHKLFFTQQPTKTAFESAQNAMRHAKSLLRKFLKMQAVKANDTLQSDIHQILELLEGAKKDVRASKVPNQHKWNQMMEMWYGVKKQLK